MRKRLWDLAKSRIEIATILPGHRHKVLQLAKEKGQAECIEAYWLLQAGKQDSGAPVSL